MNTQPQFPTLATHHPGRPVGRPTTPPPCHPLSRRPRPEPGSTQAASPTVARRPPVPPSPPSPRLPTRPSRPVRTAPSAAPFQPKSESPRPQEFFRKNSYAHAMPRHDPILPVRFQPPLPVRHPGVRVGPALNLSKGDPAASNPPALPSCPVQARTPRRRLSVRPAFSAPPGQPRNRLTPADHPCCATPHPRPENQAPLAPSRAPAKPPKSTPNPTPPALKSFLEGLPTLMHQHFHQESLRALHADPYGAAVACTTVRTLAVRP